MVYVRRFEPGFNSEAFWGPTTSSVIHNRPKNAGFSFFHTAGEPSDHDLAWSGEPGYYPRILAFSTYGAAVLILFYTIPR